VVFPITLNLWFEQKSVKCRMKLVPQLQGCEEPLGSFVQSQKQHCLLNMQIVIVLYGGALVHLAFLVGFPVMDFCLLLLNSDSFPPQSPYTVS